MGYIHIDNLYKNQEILLFKDCYALEKIHGTSTNLTWRNNSDLNFHPGGIDFSDFVCLFDIPYLRQELTKLELGDIKIYGEAYGGKCQGMSNTYGKELKFIVFDIKIDGLWLSVPQAEVVTKRLGLEFVSYQKIEATVSQIKVQAYMPSIQAQRNMIGTSVGNGVLIITEYKEREGVVLRPLIELTKNNGERIIAKYKIEKFQETKKKRTLISEEKLQVLIKADEIAEEWVTNMRLTHILDTFPGADIRQTGCIIKNMIGDIKRESEKEVIWSKEVEKAIGKNTAQLFKKRLQSNLEEK